MGTQRLTTLTLESDRSPLNRSPIVPKISDSGAFISIVADEETELKDGEKN